MVAEIYKVTSYNNNGDPVEVYVMPKYKRITSRSMAEEYGNVEVVGLSMADLPEDVVIPSE